MKAEKLKTSPLCPQHAWNILQRLEAANSNSATNFIQLC